MMTTESKTTNASPDAGKNINQEGAIVTQDSNKSTAEKERLAAEGAKELVTAAKFHLAALKAKGEERDSLQTQAGSLESHAYDKLAMVNVDRAKALVIEEQRAHVKDDQLLAAAIKFHPQAYQNSVNAHKDLQAALPDTDKADLLNKYNSLAADKREALLQNNIGVVAEHGRANFNFEKDTPQNYYVKLSSADDKAKVVWGKDLERALSESNIKTGELVALERNGKQPVTVDEPVRNTAGEIVDYTKKEATLNSWQAKQPDLEKLLTKESPTVAIKAAESQNREPATGTDKSSNQDQPKSYGEQALDALRNAKRAEKNGNNELAEKHNKNAISLAYQSGKTGEDTSKFKPASHPELIASHARGVESNEIRDRAAQVRAAEKNHEAMNARERSQQQGLGFQEQIGETKPSLKVAAPKGTEQANFAIRQGEPTNPDKDRQAKILQQINREYSGSGGKYYQNDGRGNQRLAFQDSGSKIIAQNNDQKVAFAVAAMAEAKGWSEVRVSGHADFRRNVWIEAKSRGLDVKGYTPNEHDKVALQERLDAKQRETRQTDQSGKNEKAGGTVEPVIKAVAEAVVKSQVRNPDTQQKILDRIGERQQGRKLSVPVYDLKAQPKVAQEVVKSNERAPNTERTR